MSLFHIGRATDTGNDTVNRHPHRTDIAVRFGRRRFVHYEPKYFSRIFGRRGTYIYLCGVLFRSYSMKCFSYDKVSGSNHTDSLNTRRVRPPSILP